MVVMGGSFNPPTRGVGTSNACQDASVHVCRQSHVGLRLGGRFGRSQNHAYIVPPAGWENERLNIMESVLTAKFEQNPMLMKRLVETRSKLLINGNSKRETYWGVDPYAWVGENQLGKLLTKIREKETRKWNVQQKH